MSDRPILVGMVDPIALYEGKTAITLAESFMRLAASILDEAVEVSETHGGIAYMHRVGAAMAVLTHLMEGIVLKHDEGGEFKAVYQGGWEAGQGAASSLEQVFYDEW